MTMKKHAVILALSLAAAFSALAESAKIVCPVDAPAQVKLAAREVRRYIYLRTGELLAVEAGPPPREGGLGRA